MVSREMYDWCFWSTLLRMGTVCSEEPVLGPSLDPAHWSTAVYWRRTARLQARILACWVLNPNQAKRARLGSKGFKIPFLLWSLLKNVGHLKLLGVLQPHLTGIGLGVKLGQSGCCLCKWPGLTQEHLWTHQEKPLVCLGIVLAECQTSSQESW